MPNQYNNKVVLGSETLMDITDTTAEAADVASGSVFYAKSGARSVGTASYAGAPINNGNANVANAILYGTVDSTSTSTAYTATIAGLTQLVDGTCIMLHNGVVTSAEGFTVNINGLGAKKCYNNLTNATQDTTIFNANYTMLFVYSTALDEGSGGWWIYRGYDANTNTIGYQVRTNSGNKTAADTGYRYRIWLTSADGSKWVPINKSTATNATNNRSLNTRAIDPFGPIVYRSTNDTCSADSGIGATGIWRQYTCNIGYSYMQSGFSLTYPDSVYLKCTPNADGSATMESIVQALPSTNDGKIYIYLGTAYSATSMELEIFHPVYWHDGTGIRQWTGAEYQATLVSGTNIKTVNSTSLLGSGNISIPALPSVSSSDDGKVLQVVSGSWAAATPSGGGASYSTATVTIPTTGWSSNSITVNVSGVTASNDVIVAPAPASASAWAAAGILCTAQGAGTLTFTRTSANSSALTANVMVFEGGSVTLYTVTAGLGVSVDKSEAAEGEAVTATMPSTTPGKGGYTVTVKNTATNVTLYTQSGLSSNATYTFVMPAADVTVTVSG